MVLPCTSPHVGGGVDVEAGAGLADDGGAHLDGVERRRRDREQLWRFLKEVAVCAVAHVVVVTPDRVGQRDAVDVHRGAERLDGAGGFDGAFVGEAADHLLVPGHGGVAGIVGVGKALVGAGFHQGWFIENGKAVRVRLLVDEVAGDRVGRAFRHEALALFVHQHGPGGEKMPR